MGMGEFDHIVWCDLGIVLLKIHARSPWDTKMVSTCQVLDPSRPTINIYICHEDDAVFDSPATYREKIMRQGSYRGHTFGVPARFKCMDDANIALYHPDPGKIIWSYVIKYVLTVSAIRANMLHLKGAAVAHKGKAFLFLGRGGSGKTEIVKAVCAGGAELIANTHLLVDGGLVYGVKSNMRARDAGRDFYIPVNEEFKVHSGWLPIGGVFWVKHRTDGKAAVENLSAACALGNLQHFSEAIKNWELKEDIADYFNSDPFEFAKCVNRVDEMLERFCENNSIRYLNLDIFSEQGMETLVSAMEVDDLPALSSIRQS